MREFLKATERSPRFWWTTSPRGHWGRAAVVGFVAEFLLLVGGWAHAQTLPSPPLEEFHGVDEGNHYDLVIDSLATSGFATGRLTLSQPCGDPVIWVSNWAQYGNLQLPPLSVGASRWAGVLRDRTGAPRELVPNPWWWFTCGGESDWDKYPPW